MALRVPEQHIDHIKKLLELPDEKISEFLKALAGAGPRFNVYDLATEVSRRAAVPRGLTQGLLEMLGSLYILRHSKAAALETFVDEEFAAALKSSKVLPAKKTQQEWARLRKFLLTALSLDDTLGTSAKAGQVMTDHERIFVDARVLTDVRPIFHLDVSEKPNAAVIIHMLRITQRDKDRNRTSLCFALDSNDIRSLKTLLDRAIQKEETLKKVMESSSLNILGPKAFS